MKLTITGRNLKVGMRLTERIEKKLAKMGKYFKDDVEAQVKLSHENSVRQIAEITLYLDGAILRAEETSNDMYMSIDKAIARLEGQIRRHRTKLEKRLHEEVAVEAVEEAPVWEDPADEVVRVKRFEVKPMSVEDAIAQMDMLGHSFFLFVNSETGITSVIYRRNDGKIGMLEPVMA
jgi:putative sigma-54 modulation protein